jgi:transposase
MRWIFAATLAALLSSTIARADDDAPIRRFVAEGDGTLIIEPDGTVGETTLPDELDPALRDAYARAIRRWTFEPIVVDGRAVRGRAHMSVAFAIELKGREFHRASIERVIFNDPPSKEGVASSILGPNARVHPPKYPMDLARQGIGGEVVLAVETDAEGKVLRASPQAGRLYATVPARTEARAQRAFNLLARAAMDASRHWDLPGCRSSVCTVPLRFTMQMDPDRPVFWHPAHDVSVTPETWALQTGVVALGADGSASSPRFQLKSTIDGANVLSAGG